MHVLPDEQKEGESVEMLMGVMGDDFDRDVARRVLRKYDGDVEKAASALLEGERGEEVQAPVSDWRSNSQMDISQPQPLPPTVRTNTPVIDLTRDDDADLRRAMQESINTIQPQPEGPQFGPSNRPPDANWAMVPSHQNENQSDANYLQNLERAIEASLEHNNNNDSDALEPFPMEKILRRDGCPVVLRPLMHTMVYAATILQGLFYVPQVRERMASWRPPVPPGVVEVHPPTSGSDYTLWALSEIFTYMDLALLCELNVDKNLPAFNIEPWTSLAQPPGEVSRSSYEFFAKLSSTLEKSFVDQFVHSGQPVPKPRLLHFQYGSSIGEPGELLQSTSIVPIDVSGSSSGGDANDLIGRLSAQLSKPQSDPGKQSVIFEPSEVIAFELSRSSTAYLSSTSTNGDKAERKPFVYPKSIYLDQFLRENVALAEGKRRQQKEMNEETQRLVLHKKSLTHFNGKDTLKDLQSTIYYYEHVADAKGDPERASAIQATATKLKSILDSIEQEIKTTDEKINALLTEGATLLDCDELQQVRYDLRVVFMHDGLYGRKHLYSYVHDKSSWWKIADLVIEQVTEDVVLNDHTGLHLGAGPYMLFYSRALQEDADLTSSLPWPQVIKDEVKCGNDEFLSQLPPELVKGINIEELLISSPRASAPAMDVEAPSSDRMDVT
ncbi:hypothetical protein HYDPIDRAFT_99805 [Hydnomerulius pinastri MD-312]|uniref:Unplaced genomic scaffold scaffold_45, whole genome shotgun sequence n=1 Tax=Hydnomerulius pinastri MD-312 TaxID=994086 RepID=A0A0C9V3I0_9AGAM|nr:hypothetical protein HYDPIDRAFT_99805 [Hydnomerulius pinastri MD-312]